LRDLSPSRALSVRPSLLPSCVCVWSLSGAWGGGWHAAAVMLEEPTPQAPAAQSTANVELSKPNPTSRPGFLLDCHAFSTQQQAAGKREHHAGWPMAPGLDLTPPPWSQVSGEEDLRRCPSIASPARNASP
jgi:hypothetical protein